MFNYQMQMRYIEFALSSLFRQRLKNSVITLAYTLNVFIFSSILFFTDALHEEATTLLSAVPELIVQRMRGGRHELIPVDYSAEIKKIRGVTGVTPRYWGYYYDPMTNSNYTFMGVDSLPGEMAVMEEGEFVSDPPMHCVIGAGVADLRYAWTDDIIPVQGSDGELHVLRISGVFDSPSTILTNDLVVLTPRDLKKIFVIPEGMATDLVVSVVNPAEVDTVARKIQTRLPDTRPIEKEQILRTYDALFSWRSALMVALFGGAITAFLILAWDKATGLSAEERKEIGILKAIGWKTSEILALKFWQGMIISGFALSSGMLAAYAHIFLLAGGLLTPVMKGWSRMFPELHLTPHITATQMMIITLLTVIPYIAATLIPSWKAAITDPDLIMRG